jgi:AcrR family transcriptional regulator
MSEPKKRILAAATRLHTQDGLDGVSMRTIATELGVSPMSIYRHFRNKEALLDAIVDAGFALLVDYLGRRGGKKPRPLPIIESFADFALEEPRLYELMFLRRRQNVRVFPDDFAARRSRAFDLIRDSVQREMDAGRMRRDNALETGLTIWAHAHGLISMYTLGRFGSDRGAFRKLFTRSMKRLHHGLMEGESR